jgi:hypothetical protein
VLWSGFGVPGKALLDTEFFPLEATLVDNRQRSPSCAEAAAPLTFTEASSRGDVLSRYGVPEPRPLFPRTGYASGRLQIPREGAVAPAPVCPFFARAGQSVKRSLERCEVGTYFVEDDLPQLGKLVILEDFGEACDSKESWISGARVYVLGQGKVDACGSVAFEPFPKYSEETPVLRSDRGTGHSLAMYDHRDRRASQECSPKPAIELVEEVLVWSTVEGRRSQRTLRRAFYAPVIQ